MKRMIRAGFLTLLFATTFYHTSLAQKDSRIVLDLKIDTAGVADSVALEYIPVEFVGRPAVNILKQKKAARLKWSIAPGEPVYVLIKAGGKDMLNRLTIAEPGDSVVIVYDKGHLAFSGRGAKKFQLENEIFLRRMELPKPANTSSNYTRSLEDYKEWNAYLNHQLKLFVSMVDSCQHQISGLAYQHIRARCIKNVEDMRHDKFRGLCAFYGREGQASGVTGKTLCNIYDSTFFSAPARWMRQQPIRLVGDMGFITDQVRRKFNFSREYARLTKSSIQRRNLYYEQGKKEYKGLALEAFLVKLMTSEVISEIGITAGTEALLKKYYAEPGYADYKAFVKAYELNARKLKKGQVAPDFSLVDRNGRVFRKRDLKGKVALMDFWFTGCKGCIQMVPALRKIEAAFSKDTNLVFLSISIDEDKEKWIKSLNQKKYTTGSGINLYTGGQADTHPVIKNYNVHEYPRLYLLGTQGEIVANPLPDPNRNGGKQLIDLIRGQLALLQDGPYVFYEKDKVKVYSISGNNVIEKQSAESKGLNLFVQTDEYDKKFGVQLKQELLNEPSEFRKPEKMLVLSDIEGNFDAFRKLLLANGVIDEHYNWTFGKGHLVCNGDFFDRGEQVTEVLWLIYSLEEKAKKAGGYVHYILGNHEIMNLSGNIKYVKRKYKDNALKIGKPYTALYGMNSELGRWLRTKNVVEKIGDVLFMHAGISREMNDLGLSVAKINELARPYYAADSIAKRSSDKTISLIYNTKLSPFWYREYYLDQEKKIMLGGKKGIDTIYRTPASTIDAVLETYDVSRIVTGHTIVKPGDKVTSHYGGKVINTDTYHAGDKSEALMIENDRYFRVDTSAKRILLTNENIGYTRK